MVWPCCSGWVMERGIDVNLLLMVSNNHRGGIALLPLLGHKREVGVVLLETDGVALLPWLGHGKEGKVPACC